MNETETWEDFYDFTRGRWLVDYQCHVPGVGSFKTIAPSLADCRARKTNWLRGRKAHVLSGSA